MSLKLGFLVGAGMCALAAGFIDQYLQWHRAPDAPAVAFWFVPFRLRPSLYVPDARRWVLRAWWCLGGVVLFAASALVTALTGVWSGPAWRERRPAG